MLDQIKSCQKCGLSCNQKPLLDHKEECDVIWVGLSAKIMDSDGEIPLSPKTNTGMIIKQIEDMYETLKTYKTNLVKCVPLNSQNKLRYPNQNEINDCIDNLCYEIDALSPKIVFLLGQKVSQSIEKNFNICFEEWNEYNYSFIEYNGIFYIPIQHPSYIYVYKRKELDQYIQGINRIIDRLL